MLVKERTLAATMAMLLVATLLAACGGGDQQAGPPGSDRPAPTDIPGVAEGPPGSDKPVPTVAEGQPGVVATAAGSGSSADNSGAGTLSVWTYLPPDDPSVKAYLREFQKKNPNIKVKYTAYPEDNYVTKVNTALQAHNPPDIAIIEDRSWMKANKVVELTPHLNTWGVNPADFNPGGMGRAAPEGDIAQGVYAVGDFLGGNVLFYNKDLFDKAGLEYPPTNKSLSMQEYADICRKIAKPDPNPAKAVYGCSAPFWGFGIWSKWIFGEDGHKVQSNMNSPEMVNSWNIGTQLVRDKLAPDANILRTFPAGESDLFAQGKLGITWSDFTEASKYEANKVKFGLAPFYVSSGTESFVDTWTAPWGTFTEAKNKAGALKFLRFMATDAQRIRAETSSDPPLNMKVADALNWGEGDPVKTQYLEVLQQAKPQVFVPPGVVAWNPEELFRLLTTGGKTDSKPLLDAMAQKSAPQLDRAWKTWEALDTAGK